MKHGIGIIGYGGFGAFLHKAWAELGNVSVVAVADPKARRDPGGVRFYERWVDVLGDPDVTIVAVATPPDTHDEIACTAFWSGRHVLVEKPLALTPDLGRGILAARDARQKIGSVDFMLRFNPIVAAVARLARERVFGRLRRFHVENYAQSDRIPLGHWVWDSSVSGGTLIEHAIHFFDMVHFCGVRKPVRVNGMRELDSRGRERLVSASVLYEEGAIATHNHTFAGPGAFEHTTLHFGFDLARIDVEGWVPVRGSITALVNDETRKRLTVLPGIAVRRELPLEEAPDESRPEGWGDQPTIDDSLEEPTAREHDPLHLVDTLIKGTFDVGRPKSAVYADCVRYVMTDLVSKIQSPKHRQRVTLEDGLLALEVAHRAATDSRRRGH